MQVPKKNVVTRRNFMKLSLVGLGTASAGLYLFNQQGLVDYSNPAYLYWNQHTKGNLNLEKYLVLCASLAPSAHNTQPWKFSIKEKEITVFADLKRNLGAADKERRMMLISVGCALENIAVAARQLGVTADINVDADNALVDGGLCAKVALTIDNNPKPADELFDAIFKRQTTRAPYDLQPVPDSVKSSISSLNTSSSLNLRWFDSPADLEKIAKLGEDAVQAFTQDNAAYLASLEWWRYTRHEILEKRDGISIFTSAAPTLIKQYFQYGVGPKEMQGDVGRQGEADLMKKLFAATPLWGVITANDVKNNSRLQGGQLFERVFLEATRQNYRMQAINYVSEQEAHAKKFKEAFGIPQEDEILILFRMGKSDLCEKSVRRSLDNIIV